MPLHPNTSSPLAPCLIKIQTGFTLLVRRLEQVVVRRVLLVTGMQWRRQDFVTGVEVRYGSIRRLEYEVVLSVYQRGSLLDGLAMYLSCVVHRVIRRSSMTMKAHTYYIIFGRPPIAGKLPTPGGATTDMGRVCVCVCVCSCRTSLVRCRSTTFCCWSQCAVKSSTSCQSSWRPVTTSLLTPHLPLTV